MDFGPTPNPRNPIRILLVDDNVVYRAGLRALLWMQGDLVVVGEAGTGEEAVACAKATRPHVVLMDLSMPGKGGVWAMRQLTALGVRASVLVLTALSQEWELLEALEAGARGFAEKGGPVEDLVQAIRRVREGQLFLDDSHVHHLGARVEQHGPARLNEAVAPVGFLAEEEERLVERPDGLDRGAAHE